MMAGCVLTPVAARAEAAEQATGLFVQGCLRFAGDPAGLRDWAKRAGLPAVPEQARAAFLHEAPGQAFDGSAAEVKLVLVSSDDGICSVVADKVRQSAAVDGLEAGLRQAGLMFRVVIERDDTTAHDIHNREYLAAKDGREWRILLATVNGGEDGRAMLTGAPAVKAPAEKNTR